MSRINYRIGQAAARLGVSKHHLRRLVEEGLVRGRPTKTGQLLFPDSEIDRLEEEGVPPVPATVEPEHPVGEDDDETDVDHAHSSKDELLAAPSPTVISSAEKVLASRHKLEKMRIEADIENIKDSNRERREQKAAQKAAQQAEQQGLAEAQRALHVKAESRHQRRIWIDKWVQNAIDGLPYGVPQPYHLEVRRHVELALQDVQPSQSYSLVSTLVRAASARAIEPHQRQRETEEAVEDGLSILDIWAKSSFGKPTEWQIKADRDVRAALRALPQGATSQEKQATAKAAVHKINAEFEHSRICDCLIRQITLWSGTDDERRRAKVAVEKALKATAVGSSQEDLDEIRNRELKPFEEAIEKRRKQETRLKAIEERMRESRSHIQAYLEQLESEDELEFEDTRDLTNLSDELREATEPTLRKELERRDLSDGQLHRLIERLVDGELWN